MQLVCASDPQFPPLWNSLLSEGKYLDALYGVTNLAFYREYSGCQHAEDASFLVTDGLVRFCG